MSDVDLKELIAKVRRGDSAAVALFLEEYQEAVQREVRFALLDRRLRRVVSDSDVRQSVLMNFVLGLWAGKYEFESPQQVAGLLKAMVRARVADLARHWTADKRDVRRNTGMSNPAIPTVVHKDKSPSQIVVEREILREIEQRMDDEERSILRLRQQGHSWHQLATQINSSRSPEALRKKYERSLSRISQELGFDDDSTT